MIGRLAEEKGEDRQVGDAAGGPHSARLGRLHVCADRVLMDCAECVWSHCRGVVV